MQLKLHPKKEITAKNITDKYKPFNKGSIFVAILFGIGLTMFANAYIFNNTSVTKAKTEEVKQEQSKSPVASMKNINEVPKMNDSIFTRVSGGDNFHPGIMIMEDNPVVKILKRYNIQDMAIKKDHDEYYISFWKNGEPEKNFLIKSPQIITEVENFDSFNGDVLKLVFFRNSHYLFVNKRFEGMQVQVAIVLRILNQILESDFVSLELLDWNIGDTPNNTYHTAFAFITNKELLEELSKKNIENLLLSINKDNQLVITKNINKNGKIYENKKEVYVISGVNPELLSVLLTKYGEKNNSIALIKKIDGVYNLFINNTNAVEVFLNDKYILENFLTMTLRKENVK